MSPKFALFVRVPEGGPGANWLCLARQAPEVRPAGPRPRIGFVSHESLPQRHRDTEGTQNEITTIFVSEWMISVNSVPLW